MRYLLTILLFIPVMAKAQAYKVFAYGSGTDTAYTNNNLRVDGSIRIPSYANDDNTLFLTVNSSGGLVLAEASGGGEVDTVNAIASIYRVDTTRAGIITEVQATIDDTASFLRALAEANAANIATNTSDIADINLELGNKITNDTSSLFTSGQPWEKGFKAAKALVESLNIKLVDTNSVSLYAKFSQCNCFTGGRVSLFIGLPNSLDTMYPRIQWGTGGGMNILGKYGAYIATGDSTSTINHNASLSFGDLNIATRAYTTAFYSWDSTFYVTVQRDTNQFTKPNGTNTDTLYQVNTREFNTKHRLLVPYRATFDSTILGTLLKTPFVYNYRLERAGSSYGSGLSMMLGLTGSNTATTESPHTAYNVFGGQYIYGMYGAYQSGIDTAAHTRNFPLALEDMHIGNRPDYWLLGSYDGLLKFRHASSPTRVRNTTLGTDQMTLDSNGNAMFAGGLDVNGASVIDGQTKIIGTTGEVRLKLSETEGGDGVLLGVGQGSRAPTGYSFLAFGPDNNIGVTRMYSNGTNGTLTLQGINKWQWFPTNGSNYATIEGSMLSPTATGSALRITSLQNSGGGGHNPTTGSPIYWVDIGFKGNNAKFNPSSGSVEWNTLALRQKFETSGTYSGITRSLLIDPDVTTAPPNYRGIEILPNIGYGIFNQQANSKLYWKGAIIAKSDTTNTGHNAQLGTVTLDPPTWDSTTSIEMLARESGTDGEAVKMTQAMVRDYASWNYYTGWADYTDGVYTTGSPLSLTAGTKITLYNNATTIRNSQIPIDVDSFYSRTDSTILGYDGDGLNVLIEFKVRPTTASVTKVTVTIDIGGAVGEIYPRDFILTKGNGVEHYYLSSFSAYTLDTWEANGGKVKVVTDANAELYDLRYVLTRTHKGR